MGAALRDASFMQFAGQGLTYLCCIIALAQAGDRKAAQIEQARSWWEEQAAQKAAMRAAEAEAEMAQAELIK